MAERKAVNKYYPPDWDPSKGSINKYHGQHHLRDRARKLDQGILIIRFEMPFNIWCLGCQNHIGMGVRYNAEKKRIGYYHSTPIYSFRMKCHLCSGWIEIHTDPKNAQYVVISGATRKNEQWDPSSTETIRLKDEKEAEKLALNPFYKLENETLDKEKAEASRPLLERLQLAQEKIWKKDYESSQKARDYFRLEKKEYEKSEKKNQTIQDKLSIQVPLIPEKDEDVSKSKRMKFDDSRKANPVSVMKAIKRRKIIP